MLLLDMRILVCGGRDFKDVMLMANTLYDYQIDLLIEGGADGADTLARKWAERNSVPHLEFPANWLKYGPSAGPIRNKQMLEEGEPDMVIAFPGGEGTAHMVKIAKEAGVKVIEV